MQDQFDNILTIQSPEQEEDDQFNGNLLTELTDDQKANLASVPRKRLEKTLDDLNEYIIYKAVNPDYYTNVRDALERALMLLDNPAIADLNVRQKRNQPKVRYAKNAKIYEFFPKPKKPAEPERKPADIIRMNDRRQPMPSAQYKTSAQIYQFPSSA